MGRTGDGQHSRGKTTLRKRKKATNNAHPNLHFLISRVCIVSNATIYDPSGQVHMEVILIHCIFTQSRGAGLEKVRKEVGVLFGVALDKGQSIAFFQYGRIVPQVFHENRSDEWSIPLEKGVATVYEDGGIFQAGNDGVDNHDAALLHSQIGIRIRIESTVDTSTCVLSVVSKGRSWRWLRANELLVSGSGSVSHNTSYCSACCCCCPTPPATPQEDLGVIVVGRVEVSSLVDKKVVVVYNLHDTTVFDMVVYEK
jgi:hypothetical protein